MHRGLTSAILAIATLLVCQVSWADSVTFQLHDHEDGALAPPTYGLRLDGLFAGNPGAAGGAATFSFDENDAEVFMTVDEEAGTARIFGTIYGGETTGSSYGYGEGHYQIDFLYNTNFTATPTGWVTTTKGTNAVENQGRLLGLDGAETGGRAWDLYDYVTNGPSFLFQQDGHRTGDANDWVGRGWLSTESDHAYRPLTMDFLFIGQPWCEAAVERYAVQHHLNGHALWFPGLYADGQTAVLRFRDGAEFIIHEDGTATLTGTAYVYGGGPTGDAWQVTLEYVQRSGAGSGGPKREQAAIQPMWLTETWAYFDMTSGVMTQPGSTVNLSVMPADGRYPFQFGDSANNKNARLGASAWFFYDRTYDNITLDFDTDGAGDPILPGQDLSEAYADLGVHIVTFIDVNMEFIGIPAAFDSSNPVPGFEDHGTPNEAFGGPGVGAAGATSNDEALGNILVSASNYLDVGDDGILADPNPYPTATWNWFFFEEPVCIVSYDLIDIDADEVPVSVPYFDVDGNVIERLQLQETGDNGVVTVDHTAQPICNTSLLMIDFLGTGGIDNIVYTRPPRAGHGDINVEMVPIAEAECCDATVGDFVWFDANQDGVQDAGELGIEGVGLVLTDANGAAIASATTDASGAYLFTDLCEGDYSVSVDGGTVPAGYAPTLSNVGDDATDSDPNDAPVSLERNSEDLTIDFGYSTCAPCEGSVTALSLRYIGDEAGEITIYDHRRRNLLYSNHHEPGDVFSFVGANVHEKMNPNIYTYIDGELDAFLHTSCSVDIYVGLLFGEFEVVGGRSLDGGLLCVGEAPVDGGDTSDGSLPGFLKTKKGNPGKAKGKNK